MLKLLWGCSHTLVHEDGLTYGERQTQLQTINDWKMNGRIVVETDAQAFQGRFQWQQSGNLMDLSIRGPFGANVLRVEGSPKKLIVYAQGKNQELLDPEQELSDLLGWWLPVNSLKTWLVGLSDPAFPSKENIGSDSTLSTLDQRLWTLNYDSYQLMDGIMIPKVINLSHNELKLRLIVDQWSYSS